MSSGYKPLQVHTSNIIQKFKQLKTRFYNYCKLLEMSPLVKKGLIIL